MKKLSVGAICCTLIAGSAALLAGDVSNKLPLDSASVVGRLKKDLTYLSSDALEGRGIDTAGNRKAIEFARDVFKEVGLKSAVADGSYFQPFKISSAASLVESKCKLTFQGPENKSIELTIGKDYQPLIGAAEAKFDAPIAFVGFGTVDADAKFDELANGNVEGKVVLFLRGTPRLKEDGTTDGSPANRQRGALMTKLRELAKRKAVAALFVNNPFSAKSAAEDKLDSAMFLGPRTTLPLPAFQIKQEVADRLLASSNVKNVKEAEEQIAKSKAPVSLVVENWKATGSSASERKEITVNNVVGVLEGEGPLANETVVIGGHIDHVGYGATGSLAGIYDQIHNGADDNGSGSVTVLELARRFATREKKPARRMVFMLFNGEESGLIGSKFYADNPIFPNKDTIAMLNFDMVGRLNGNDLSINGRKSAKEFEELAQRIGKGRDFKMKPDGAIAGNSDHASFYAKGIPVYFFCTGLHADYHRPSDKVEKINFDGMRRIADYGEALADAVIANPQRPQYVKLESEPRRGQRGAVSWGIMPARNPKNDGLLVRSVSEKSAADKAGIKGNDVIVEIAGKPVRTITDYSGIRDGLDLSKDVEVVVMRDGAKVTVKVAGQAPPANNAAKKGDGKSASKNPPRRARPYFGARPTDAADGKGATIDGLVADSPAGKAGLKDGDIIVEWEGQPITDSNGYNTLLMEKVPGDKVKFVIVRNGERKSIELTLTTRPSPADYKQ